MTVITNATSTNAADVIVATPATLAGKAATITTTVITVIFV